MTEPRPRPLPKATSSPSRRLDASGTLRITATSRPVPGQGARLADDGEPSSVGYAIERDPRDLIWPLGIAFVLLLFVTVNAAFAWVAVSHAPEVDPTYTHARER